MSKRTGVSCVCAVSRVSCVLFVVLMEIVVGATSALAQQKDDCFNPGKPMPREQRIKDCTRLIELGKLSRENLSIAYSNRGGAYRTSDNERALRDLVKAIELDPKNASAFYNRALVYRSLQQAVKSLDDLNRSIELDPKDWQSWLERGKEFNSRDQFARAIADLDKAIALNDKSAPAYYSRGLALISIYLDDRGKNGRDANKEKLLRAMADYSRAVEIEPSAEILKHRANGFVLLGSQRDANGDLDHALKLDPKYRPALLDRAKYHLDAQEFEPAIALATRVLEGAPKTPRAAAIRARALAGSGKHAAALVDFDAAVLAEPKDHQLRFDRGYLLLEYLSKMDNAKDRAIADFTAAMAIEPDNGFSYLNRARAYQRLDKHALALEDFAVAIRLLPDNDAAYRFRSTSYLAQKAFDRAMTDANKAIELAPKDAVLFYNRAMIREAMAELPAAIADLDKAVELEGNDGVTWLSARGLFFHNNKIHDREVADLTLIIARTPPNADAHSARAEAFIDWGKPAEGLADIDRAIKLDVDEPSHKMLRAKIFEATGRKAEAIADYKTALNKDPQLAEAKQALMRLGERP